MSDVDDHLRLDTERLRLRRVQTSDALSIAELANDAELASMTTGVTHPYRLGDAQAFLAREAGRDHESGLCLLIGHRQFGPIGLVSLIRSDALWPELGYWVGRTFRGRGFASEAVAAALDWAADAWRQRAIGSGHFVDNPASACVLERCGFLYTGVVEHQFSLGRGCDVPTRKVVWLA